MLKDRGAAVAVAALVGLLGCPSPATAHESAPSLTPVVDGFAPDVADVDVTVQASQDATLLAVVPSGGAVVELLGDDGEPWARITDAVVEADITSRSFHAATNANGLVPDPLPARDDPWVVVGREGRFQWFEHRLHPAGFEVPSDVLASDRAQDVASWSLPMRVDGADVELRGRIRHVPVTGRVEPRLRTPRELAPGVVVEVAPGAVPAFFLRNDGAVAVTVLARDGSPYVVLDRDGAAVNVASPTWVEQRRFEGEVGPVADDVVLERISTTPSHTWLDSRAALPGIVPDEDVRAGGAEVVLRSWSIPVEVGGELRTIDGESVWVPLVARAGPGLQPRARGPEYVVAAVVAAALVAVAVWRRRRRG